MSNPPNDAAGKAILRAMDHEVKVRKVLARRRSRAAIIVLDASAGLLVFFALADFQASMTTRIIAAVAGIAVTTLVLELIFINLRLNAAVELIKLNENKPH